MNTRQLSIHNLLVIVSLLGAAAIAMSPQSTTPIAAICMVIVVLLLCSILTHDKMQRQYEYLINITYVTLLGIATTYNHVSDKPIHWFFTVLVATIGVLLLNLYVDWKETLG